jgi:hypothetical protein
MNMRRILMGTVVVGIVVNAIDWLLNSLVWGKTFAAARVPGSFGLFAGALISFPRVLFWQMDVKGFPYDPGAAAGGRR